MKKKFSKKEIVEIANKVITNQEEEIHNQAEQIRLQDVIVKNYKLSNDKLYEIVENDWDKLTPYQIMSVMMLDKDKKVWRYATIWELYTTGKIKLGNRHLKTLTELLKGKSIAAIGLKLKLSTSSIKSYAKEINRLVKQYEEDEDLTLDYDVNKLSKDTREMVVNHRLYLKDIGILTPVRGNIVQKKHSKVATDVYNKSNKAKNTSIVEDEFFKEEER
jgi:hypothetical protein